MKQVLTLTELATTAREFCLRNHVYPKLFGVTDGKAVGTFIEHEFQAYLASLYDILAFLIDRNLPGDEIVLNNLTDEIIQSPPASGYLTISNALQWRLQYGRIVSLNKPVDGIIKIV